MQVEPFPHDTALIGPTAPKCEQVDDLLRMLATIRERFGNTAVRYRITWGSQALWAEDDLRREIARLMDRVDFLSRKVRRLKNPGTKKRSTKATRLQDKG